MKLTAQEEYGLRCLLQIGRRAPNRGLTIPQVGAAEGISVHHAGKILQILRHAGFLKAARGQAGGYTLARPPEEIVIGDVVSALGGRLYEDKFCDGHTGSADDCTHSIDCSIRSLWRTVQTAVDEVLGKTTLKDLLRKEEEMNSWLNGLVTLEPTLAPVAGAPDRRT